MSQFNPIPKPARKEKPTPFEKAKAARARYIERMKRRNVAPKEHKTKVQHNRRALTAKQRGEISASVAAKVDIRSGNRCEFCGWAPGDPDDTGQRMNLERAHLIRRHKIDGRTTEHDVAKLCGPSTNTNTCHWEVDSTRAGRERAAAYRLQLIEEADHGTAVQSEIS